MSRNGTSTFTKRSWAVLTAMTAIASAIVPAMSQSSGGPFVLEQSVIANGGGQSSGGAFTVAGTNAQPIAGTLSANAQFSLHGGFWNAGTLTTTAAFVPVGGRVITASGQGIRGVRVLLTLGTGAVRSCITGTFGFYRFDDVEAGQVVIVSVEAKRFTFAQSSMVLNLSDSSTDVDFVANSN